MASQGLEKRVELLETRVAEMQTLLLGGRVRKGKNWRRAVEKYAGDEDLKHILAQAAKLREADRNAPHALLTGPLAQIFP
jgi:hypothetical protein